MRVVTCHVQEILKQLPYLDKWHSSSNLYRIFQVHVTTQCQSLWLFFSKHYTRAGVCRAREKNRSCFWLLFDWESCSNFCSKRINGLSLDMNVASYSFCWLWYSKGSVWPIEWRFKLTCAIYWAGLAIIYTVSLVVFGLIETFEFHLFLQNVRAQMTDILWMTVDMFH